MPLRLSSPAPGKLQSVGRVAAAVVFVLLLFGVTFVAVTATSTDGQAAKRKPCWEQLVDDWTQDQRVDGRYSAACINEALKNVPEDVRAYSSFEDEARAARIEGTRSLQGSGGDTGSDGSGGGSAGPGGPGSGTPDETLVQRALGASGNNADSIPIPLLILLAISAVLITAGGAGFAARKVKALRASR
jgi:hypothetical protein